MMDIIEQIESHLERLGLTYENLGPVSSIVVHEVEDKPGMIRLCDDHGEWIGPAELALEKLVAQESLTWEEFWELFHEDYQ